MEFALIIAIAILIEALVEYGKTIIDMFDNGDKKTAITQIITIILGIFIAFAFKANVFELLKMPVNNAIGTVLTGIIISRGSNYASDLLSRISNPTPVG